MMTTYQGHDGYALQDTSLVQNSIKYYKIVSPQIFLKGLGHDSSEGLFTKIIWHEILIEFLQKVIKS